MESNAAEATEDMDWPDLHTTLLADDDSAEADALPVVGIQADANASDDTCNLDDVAPIG